MKERVHIIPTICVISAAVVMLGAVPMLIAIPLIALSACYGAGFSVIPAILAEHYGMNDISMINGEGVVGIWGVNDGYLSSWSILSAVDTSAWELAGVGDFNGDGSDDIAWRQTSTGLTGYWQINDKTLTGWQNIATIA